MTKRNMKQQNQLGALLVVLTLLCCILIIFVTTFSSRTSQPTPQPSISSEEMLSPPETTTVKSPQGATVFRATTLPLSFTHSNQLHVYEETRDDRGYGAGISVVYGEVQNVNFFLIKKTLPTNFNDLKVLKIGQKYHDKTTPDDTIIATRLTDTTIAGKKTLVYEWNKLWEIHGPVREYFIPYQQSYLHIRVTYSNGFPENDDGKFDYIPAYEQILSTLSFTN